MDCHNTAKPPRQIDFDIVSPEFPAGSAWLVNCLFELNIPIWDLWDIKIPNSWALLPDGGHKYQEPEGLWDQTLPALKHGRRFAFDPNISGRASHRWPMTLESPADKTIFFVRDPRDMLFSQWRRLTHNEPRFKATHAEFLQSRYHKHPLTQSQYLTTFLLAWHHKLQSQDHCIIHFEDYRSNPVRTLGKALNFLNVSRSPEAIVAATEASDYQKVKQVEDALKAQGKLTRKFNFKGQAHEHRTRLAGNTENLFNLDFSRALSLFDYPPLQATAMQPQIEWNKPAIKALTLSICGMNFPPATLVAFRRFLTQSLQQPAAT